MGWLELIETPSDGILDRSHVYYVNKAKQSVLKTVQKYLLQIRFIQEDKP